jgi:hypothetical protein
MDIAMVLLGCGPMISPGVGFFGGLIAMLPQAVTELSHEPAYGLLTWLFAAGMSAAFVFGLLMKICPAFVSGRVVDSGDIFVNTMGIGMAALLIWWRAMPAENPDKIGIAEPGTPAA